MTRDGAAGYCPPARAAGPAPVPVSGAAVGCPETQPDHKSADGRQDAGIGIRETATRPVAGRTRSRDLPKIPCLSWRRPPVRRTRSPRTSDPWRTRRKTRIVPCHCMRLGWEKAASDGDRDAIEAPISIKTKARGKDSDHQAASRVRAMPPPLSLRSMADGTGLHRPKPWSASPAPEGLRTGGGMGLAVPHNKSATTRLIPHASTPGYR